MKKYIYTVGAFALALGMSGVSAVAYAEDGGGDGQSNNAVQITNVQVQATGETSGEQQKQNVGVSREQQRPQIQQDEQVESTSSRQTIGEDQNEQEIKLDLEDEQNPATSIEDLKQKIEVRKQQLEQELASTTPADQNIVENANPVRLAVHSLLASKQLLGGIGPEVSQIAKEMNDSVATTTNVEAKIQSRGILTRFFFGGDSAAAEVIAQEVARNQANIAKLTDLLNQGNVPADVQATLQAQITALQDAQTRLADLAQKEQSQWGLFSWRF